MALVVYEAGAAPMSEQEFPVTARKLRELLPNQVEKRLSLLELVRGKFPVGHVRPLAFDARYFATLNRLA